MTTFVHHEECRSLAVAIAPFATPVKDEPPHWICTPDGDLGSEWCSACGYYKVRNLRRKDRRRAGEYLLDGGWVTEAEQLCRCAGCGKRLRVSLLKYGVEEELLHYREWGFGSNIAETAYEIVALLDACETTREEDADMAQEVIELGQRFITLHAADASP